MSFQFLYNQPVFHQLLHVGLGSPKVNFWKLMEQAFYRLDADLLCHSTEGVSVGENVKYNKNLPVLDYHAAKVHIIVGILLLLLRDDLCLLTLADASWLLDKTVTYFVNCRHCFDCLCSWKDSKLCHCCCNALHSGPESWHTLIHSTASRRENTHTSARFEWEHLSSVPDWWKVMSSAIGRFHLWSLPA